MFEIEGRPTTVTASEATHALTHIARLSQSASSTGGRTEELLAELGDSPGETWQHLYGLTLDTDHTLPALIDLIQNTDPVDFRRTLLGITSWSWVNILGLETLEAAAQGEASAGQRLLSNNRYYSGSARSSLATVVTWSPDETKERYLAILRSYESEFSGQLAAASPELAALESEAIRILEDSGFTDGLAQLTGYRYIAEPEAERVAVLMHGVDDSLCLAQHDGTRLIVNGTQTTFATKDLVELGRALSDESRIHLLQLISQGPTDLGPLVEGLSLTRSTVHHHLSILRKAGLVEVEGNARAYRYRLSPGAESTWLGAWKKLFDEKGRTR